jgi:3-oxoacyl-[acyl-carrier protein] reductase
MIDLSGKRAFVTGGGRGIGRATALLLARAGAKVAVGYRSRKPAAEPHITAAVRGDLGTTAGATKAVGEALRALGGKLDILVINHGVWPSDDVPVAKMTDEQWESTRRANLDAVIYVCRAAIPEISEGGTIVLWARPRDSAARRSTPIMPRRRARSFP